MEERIQMDKPSRDLIQIIHFTEKVSLKIHGLLNESDIYRAVMKEFENSKQYNASIVLLTDDGSKLRVVGSSIAPKTLKMAEKVSGLRLKDYKLNLTRSSIYRQVVSEGRTLQVDSRDMMTELFSRPLVHLLSKIIDFKNKKSIVTPLKLHEKIIGALTMSSTDLAEYFIPSVKNLAQHISTALELDAHRRALIEKEQRLKTNIDTSPDAIVWIDTNGKITLVNRKGLEITGFSEEDLIGKNFMDAEVLTQESKEKILKALTKRLKGMNTPPYEVEIVTKNGQTIPFEISASPIFEGNKIVGGQSIFRDLRERKKMEKKLRQYSEQLEDLVEKRTKELKESEKRYSVLVEEASDGVVIIQDAKIVFVNKRAAEIVGYAREELIGHSFDKFLDEKTSREIQKLYMGRMRGEKVPTLREIKIPRRNGRTISIETSARLINYHGRPADFAIMRDISERKRAEEERLKLEKLAAIGELATMVGHDLRNPLQSIENATYVLNNELQRHDSSTSIPRKTMKMLQTINDSVSYADKIIRDLQDFSGTKRPRLEKNNVNAIVKEVLSRVETSKNVELIMKLGRLPEIEVDRDMIERVFLNLATNGAQAMEEKGGLLIVSTKETKKFVEVSFKDTGIGIPKENMEKLFTPFFTTRAKGMGMGLATCKKLIDSHGGSIETESEEGKGSTFTVKLPVQPET
ncbi:MAG: PAS domain S-box protein [Candidatus Bathyarchaeota archaeon]|nr:MAG: PAS domain S-box protein [Candidatus Bathyarchaeota archaeon]